MKDFKFVRLMKYCNEKLDFADTKEENYGPFI
jgi:hypothetical protein